MNTEFDESMKSTHRAPPSALWSALLLFGTAGLAGAGTPDAIHTENVFVHRLGPVGAHGWGAVDVDADGRLDLVTSSDGPASIVLVYGRVGPTSTLRLKQQILLPPDSIAALATLPSGPSTVATVDMSYRVTLYGGWPLVANGGFDVAHATSLMRVGDVDADGILDLLCIGGGGVSAYALPDGEQKWSMTLAAADLVLADLDDDPALELVVAGGDSASGLVIDGETLLTEWTHPAGFGTHLAVGDFGGSWQRGIIGAKDWGGVDAFVTSPYALHWSTSATDVDAVAAGDTDADGQDEYAIGDGQWGSIWIHDAASRQMLYRIDNQGWGLWAAGFLDFDGDAREELWYSSQIERSTDYDSYFAGALVDPFNAHNRLVIESYYHGATANRLADLDGDGQREWMIGTYNRWARQGLLQVLDANTLSLQWRGSYWPDATWGDFRLTPRSFQVAQLDADPALELVIVGDRSTKYGFLVLDGASFDVETPLPPWDPLSWEGSAVASRLVQHVIGGNQELLVALDLQMFGVPSVQFRLYSLPQGTLVWSSAIVGGGSDRTLGMDVGQLDSDPALEYLAIHSGGFVAFDAATGAQEWTMSMPIAGARIVPRDEGDALFVFTEAGEVTTYDVATRLPVETFLLPPPLKRLSTLPGTNDWLLADAGERLLLISTEGDVVASSDWIGAAPDPGDNLDIQREGRGWRVSIGRSFGSFQFLINDPDELFRDGFEASSEPATLGE